LTSDERWKGRGWETGCGFKIHQKFFMSKRYTVSDGKLVLNLEEAEEGGYLVTSPLNPELITQAETIEEAFANARDAAKALKQSRTRLVRRLSASKKPG